VNPLTAFRWSLQTGQYTDLGVVDGVGTAAYDIDEQGNAVVADAAIVGVLAAIWTVDGHLQPIDSLPAGQTAFVRRIAGNLAVGGSAVMLAKGTSQPVVWTKRSFTLLGTLPGFDRGGVGAMNSSGVVTGINGSSMSNQNTAFVWERGFLRDLNTLSIGEMVFKRGVGVDEAGTIVAEADSTTAVVSVLLAPKPGISGDTNCDDSVDIDDLIAVILEWDELQSHADVTGDGVVNVDDMILVIENWSFG
jgi:hypothetical protein